MKMYYDFHMHTGLSPCGDADMTPNNIVNMSIIKGLECIAVTDHNTCGNAKAVIDVAKAAGNELIVIPGMEVETAEEFHVVCLFGDIESALACEEVIQSTLPPIKNRKDIFGPQFLFDAEDNVIGEEERMLLTATGLDFCSLLKEVKRHGGIAYPAHIDRPSYSIMASLGFIPNDVDINIIEISKNSVPKEFIANNARLIGRDFYCLQSSDAHYLENISERENFFDLGTYEPSSQNIIKRLLEL